MRNNFSKLFDSHRFTRYSRFDFFIFSIAILGSFLLVIWMATLASMFLAIYASLFLAIYLHSSRDNFCIFESSVLFFFGFYLVYSECGTELAVDHGLVYS